MLIRKEEREKMNVLFLIEEIEKRTPEYNQREQNKGYNKM